MNLLTTLLASFLAVAAANLHCEIVPFLSCKGGIDQQIACGDAWECPGNGLRPIISNATCAAHNISGRGCDDEMRVEVECTGSDLGWLPPLASFSSSPQAKKPEK
ncbi:hypothetical protein FB451DRAFT_1182821 [Mycena latifolia]|nr:hypothetical protein FB451DRAFT_1182821 [Mycena latifolia]